MSVARNSKNPINSVRYINASQDLLNKSGQGWLYWKCLDKKFPRNALFWQHSEIFLRMLAVDFAGPELSALVTRMPASPDAPNMNGEAGSASPMKQMVGPMTPSSS
jgi:hypothetical protein